MEFDNYRFRLSSKGMGLSIVELRSYSDRENQNIVFENPESKIANFATSFNSEVVDFQMSQISDKEYVGVAQVGTQQIQKKLLFDPSNYSVSVSIKTLSGNPGIQDVLVTELASKVLKIESSFLTPAYEGTEYFVIDEGSEARERVDISSSLDISFKQSTFSSIGSLYFAVGLKDQSSVIPSSQFSFKAGDEMAYMKVIHKASTEQNKTNIQYTGFFGPKKFDILKTLDPEFTQMINFGIFGILSKPILSLLKWLHGLLSNWGLAIICLTIIIRMFLLPINISSLKAMKKMQKIQPQLKALKEKYKEDPQRMNQETMALMRREKANPLGGCLPMFLQIPVFFALYSVISQSVELYKQPFVFWIQDLSYKDPFFVLPVSVGILYFVQMSLTPQTGMDPAQAKMMKFVPLLFCFFMITVPSGLALYFFINTVFGIGQQFVFQRERRKASA